MSRIAATIAVAFALLPFTASAATLSMQEFLQLEPQWSELAAKNESLRIEGRIESASPKLLRMRKCPLEFRPAQETIPEIRRPNGRIELTGLLQRRGTDLVFVVTELREVPDDLQVYALKQSALDTGDPSDWYALASWAIQRATFYDDKSLLERATQARRRGLSLERQAAADNPEALAALAKKAADFKLPELDEELQHESLRLRFERLRNDPKSDLAPLLDDVRRSLPGADRVLDVWPGDVAAQYAAEPLAVYNRADAATRPVLDRIFLAEAQLVAIERKADPDGANGEEIAEQIALALPERTDLADRYREREIAWRLDHITTATRAEALDLASRLEVSNREEEAKQALTKWLAAREVSQRADGPAGLVGVAEDYVAVLGDKPNAARLLLEALKANPESKTIPDKLRQIGYVRVENDWMTKEEADARPVEPTVQAMREGRVINNMTAEQVRKTLGAPDRVARAASTTQIHEAWIYGTAGRSGLVVHFLRYSARNDDEGRVVGVAKLVR